MKHTDERLVTGFYASPCGDGTWQAVYPEQLADLSATYPTHNEAVAAIEKDLSVFSAAPLMLAALQLVVDHDGKLTGGDWADIQDVVAKAKGRE